MAARLDEGTRADRTGATALLLLCALLAVAAFGNSLQNGFVYDDRFVIVEGTYVKSWSNYFRIYSPRDAEQWGAYVDPNRPATNLTYFLDYSLWGMNPRGYHLSNLILHVAATTFLFLLARALSRSRLAATAAASVFAVHPALSEAVNCVSYREDLLVGALVFASLWLYARAAAESVRAPRLLLAISIVLFAIALLAKEMAVTLPLLLVLHDRVLHRGEQRFGLRARGSLYLAYTAPLLAYAIFRAAVTSGMSQREFYGGGAWPTLLTMTRVVRRYVELLIYPHDLNADYVLDVSTTIADARVLASLFVLVVLLAVGLAARRRAPLVCFSVFAFLIGLLPVSNLLPLYHIVAERYLYFPAGLLLLGFGDVVGNLLPRFVGRALPRTRSPRLAIVPSVVVVLACAGTLAHASVQRNRVWRDEYSLWSATLQVEPESYQALHHLGVHYSRERQYERALDMYRRALRLRPRQVKTITNMGNVYARMGRNAEAIRYYQRALAIEPDYAVAHGNLGRLYMAAGRLDDAILEYREALRLRPRYVRAAYNLGLLYEETAALGDAVVMFRRVAEIDPTYRDAAQRLRSLENRLGGSTSGSPPD